jgi:hypothetical protein
MHQFRQWLDLAATPTNGPYLALAHVAQRSEKWAVSIDSIPLETARRTLAVKAVDAQAARRCWEPAVECSGSTIVWPAPYVARTRTCAGDLRIPLTVMPASFRLSLAALATHLPPELLIPPAGPSRALGDNGAQVDT